MDKMVYRDLDKDTFVYAFYNDKVEVYIERLDCEIRIMENKVLIMGLIYKKNNFFREWVL